MHCMFIFSVSGERRSVHYLTHNRPLSKCCTEALPGGGGSHVTCLNFKTSRVCVYKCLSLIVGFANTVAICPREVVSRRDFILHAVATFWAMSLVRIYPGRASCTEIPPLSYSFNSQSS